MSDKESLLLCYNRGCGQSFDPDKNTKESCRHHSGVPVFHDAYKGWSCCNKKCTDFTEFLNIKGCTISYHNSVKPPEPEKPQVDKSTADEVITVRAPQPPPELRPPFDSPLVRLKPQVTTSLVEALQKLKCSANGDPVSDDPNLITSGNIPPGTTCKNNACKAVYEGPETDKTDCTHHPGYPVFHEGLKFWSCCTKRTTEFDVFLAQPGCSTGSHLWFKKLNRGEVKCRLDWHQTGTHVYVSIFGKKVDPDSSIVEVSPIRVKLELSFPEQGGAYIRDMELAGVIDVEKSSVSMNPSKVELKLAKRGPGSWSKLDLPRVQPQPPPELPLQPPEPQVEGVDLNFI